RAQENRNRFVVAPLRKKNGTDRGKGLDEIGLVSERFLVAGQRKVGLTQAERRSAEKLVRFGNLGVAKQRLERRLRLLPRAELRRGDAPVEKRFRVRRLHLGGASQGGEGVREAPAADQRAPEASVIRGVVSLVAERGCALERGRGLPCVSERPVR